MNNICITTAGKAITAMLKKCGLVVNEKEESMISVGMKFLAEYNSAVINISDQISGTVAVENDSNSTPEKVRVYISVETGE